MYGVQSFKSFLVGHHHVEIIGSSSKERNKNSNNISDRTYKQGQSWFDLCLYDLCFIVLCYKGRKDTIVPGGSQFSRYNLSVSLCLKERPKWKIRSDFVLCGSLQFQLGARKPAFVRFQTSDRICHFFPILTIILQFFNGIILQDKLHSFSVQDDRNTRFPSTTNYKNNNIIKRFYIENSPLDRTVQSGQSAMYAG